MYKTVFYYAGNAILETTSFIHQSYGSTFASKIMSVMFVSSAFQIIRECFACPVFEKNVDWKLSIQEIVPRMTGWLGICFISSAFRER